SRSRSARSRSRTCSPSTPSATRATPPGSAASSLASADCGPRPGRRPRRPGRGRPRPRRDRRAPRAGGGPRPAARGGRAAMATAAVLSGVDAPFELAEVDVGEPAHGEVRVRVVGTGVCHTDQVVREGSYPYELPAVLGHEGAGVVEAVGPGVTGIEEGDHVV